MGPNDALVRQIIDQDAFRTVFQPIFSLSSGQLTTVEALTRITLASPSAPVWWLSEAHIIGLGVELELVVLRRALSSATSLPGHLALSVNLSPAALIDPATLSLLAHRPVRSLIVELTEQPSLHIHPHLLRQRDRLRETGIQLAIGNIAAQRASMARLLALKPNQVKTDLWLTAGIDTDSKRRILARKLLRVAHHQQAEVVAEGIETPAQLEAWKQLGADAGQGFLLATPAPLDEALQARAITVH